MEAEQLKWIRESCRRTSDWRTSDRRASDRRADEVVVIINEMVVRPGRIVPACSHKIQQSDCLACIAGNEAKVLKASKEKVWVEYPNGDIALLEFKDNRWRFWQASKNEG